MGRFCNLNCSRGSWNLKYWQIKTLTIFNTARGTLFKVNKGKYTRLWFLDKKNLNIKFMKEVIDSIDFSLDLKIDWVFS